jgi:hypothetical protein
MRFQDAMFVMIDEQVAIKREGWHFSVFYVVETGEFHTGYNNEQWFPQVEDYIAEDWVVYHSTDKPKAKLELVKQ